MSARKRCKVVAGLERLLVPIGSLVPDPKNARRHDERNLATIEASLRRFGQHVPLVVSAHDSVVRVGNGRLEAARRMGWTHVAVVRVAESEVAAVGRAIADNRTGELSEWDVPALERTLAALEAAGVDLVALGWSEEELRGLVGGLEPAARAGEGANSAIGEVVIRHPVGSRERAKALATTAVAGMADVTIEDGGNVVEEA